MTRYQTYYRDGKESARQEAIEWQAHYADRPRYMSEDAKDAAYFRALAKRYGLVEEFTENGII